MHVHLKFFYHKHFPLNVVSNVICLDFNFSNFLILYFYRQMALVDYFLKLLASLKFW